MRMAIIPQEHFHLQPSLLKLLDLVVDLDFLGLGLNGYNENTDPFLGVVLPSKVQLANHLVTKAFLATLTRETGLAEQRSRLHCRRFRRFQCSLLCRRRH